MLRLDSVTKTYRHQGGRQVILGDVTLELPGQMRLGILGRNGAGKSTLLKLLAGSEPVDAGQIILDGAVSFPVGFTGTFHPNISARDNLHFLCTAYGMDLAETAGWIEEFAELGAYFDMPVAAYSSGMFARLAMATSFAFEFDIYLVDEAFEVGDARFRAKCAAAFEARLHDASLILVSQNMDTIRRHCDRAAVMHQGKLEVFDRLDDAFARFEDTMSL
jgi:capsular polysaccharide transport system ATP-binding protein